MTEVNPVAGSWSDGTRIELVRRFMRWGAAPLALVGCVAVLPWTSYPAASSEVVPVDRLQNPLARAVRRAPAPVAPPAPVSNEFARLPPVEAIIVNAKRPTDG